MNKREENTKHLDIFHFWVQECQKNGQFWAKNGNFDFEKGHFQKSTLPILAQNCPFFEIFELNNGKFPSIFVFCSHLFTKFDHKMAFLIKK